MLAQTGVILAAVIGAETEPRRRRTGGGGTGEPTNETTRSPRTRRHGRSSRTRRHGRTGPGSAGRKTDDSGAERTRGHSPHVRPPALRRRPRPSTAMPPTHVKQYNRQGSPRSGPDRHALHPAGRAPAGFFGFVKPAGPAAGGRDVFVLGSAVKHVDGTDVERAEWPRLDGKRIAVDRTARRPAGRPQATAARPAQDLRRARRPAGRPRGTPKGRQRPLQAHRGAVAPLLHEQHSGDRGPNTAPRPQLRPMARACNRVDSPT